MISYWEINRSDIKKISGLPENENLNLLISVIGQDLSIILVM